MSGRREPLESLQGIFLFTIRIRLGQVQFNLVCMRIPPVFSMIGNLSASEQAGFDQSVHLLDVSLMANRILKIQLKPILSLN